VTAVHVANILAHEQAKSSGGDDQPFTPLDEMELQDLGILDRLPEWRQIAERSMGAARSSEWTECGERRAA
jgi:hypothetical protein